MNKFNYTQEGAYIVVDDQIFYNTNDREDFRLNFGKNTPEGFFAKDFVTALKLFADNPNIVIVFCDLEVPYDSSQGISQDTKEKYWGINLISEIPKINKNCDIVVNSAYIQESSISERIKKIRSQKNVVACYGKPDGKKHRKTLYEKARIKHLPNLQSLELNNISGLDSLDEDLTRFLIMKTRALREIKRENLINNYRVGQILLDVKAKLEFGLFTDWVMAEFDTDHTRNAQRLMAVSRAYTPEEISELSCHKSTTMSLLYALTRKDVTVDERNKVFELIKNGQRVSCNSFRETLGFDKSKNQSKSTTIDVEVTNIQDVTNIQNAAFSTKNIEPNLLELEINRHQSNNLVEIKPGIKQQIIKVIKPQLFWQVGEQDHLIVCAEPDSEKFLAYLSECADYIDLCLWFPKNLNWQPPQINCINTVVFHENKRAIAQFDDEFERDDKLWQRSLKYLCQANTAANSNVVVGYLPFDEILAMIDEIECRAFIADPDRDKCLALAEAYKQQNQNTVE